YDFRAAVPPFDEWDVASRTWAPPREAVIGDAWHRFMVRMLELVESIKLVRQGLDRYPQAKGSHRIDPPRQLPAGETYVETECPRGQMGFYVVGRPSKDAVPLRVRARSSSFSNLSVTDDICRNCLIADVPAIVGSIDIVMGEIDR
ncbi:MAG: NADH-quinone oxidoreductase subunit D, partial [Gemmataceae bacterium]|nr:NADH-quinone oxidoreductase subunit D [Gemmataceae bacterium]